MALRSKTLICAVVGMVFALPAYAGDTGTPPAAPVEKAAPQQPDDCLTGDGGFQTKGSVNSFVVAIENTCEKRFRCQIYAYITGAKGPTLGHGTVILGPKSSGSAAKKSYAIKVKMAGGTAEVSRECKGY
jgi:hypothetical protein